MKRAKFFLILSTLFYSCQGTNKTTKDVPENDSQNAIKTIVDKKQEAISILNDVNYWVRKGIREEIPPSEVNKHVDPLMEKYQQILPTLSYADSIEVQDYRMQELNKIVELQMRQDKK